MADSLRLERQSSLLLPLAGDDCTGGLARLQALLADPQRLLGELLRGEKLEPLGDGQFHYRPTPLSLNLLGLHLEPVVHVQATWSPPALLIHLIGYKVAGLDFLERKTRYQFQAQLQPVDQGLQLEAQAQLELLIGQQGLRLPPPLLSALGNTVLTLIFGRLEQRCRSNLGPFLSGVRL